MSEGFLDRIDAIIAHSEENSHFIAFGSNCPPELSGLYSERAVVNAQFAGNVFISHSSADERLIERFVLPSVRKAAGRRFFFLNQGRYAARREGDFQHALWVRAALEVCKTVILIWSNACRHSDWIRWEGHHALNQGHPVIICRADNTEINYETFEYRGAPRAPIVTVDLRRWRWFGRKRLFKLLQTPDFSVSPWKGRALGTPVGPEEGDFAA